eukprot:12094250-Ditylum_brightwellii.AAC.1
MEKLEKHCEKMCKGKMFNSKKQVSAIGKLNKVMDKQESLPDELENRTVKDIIIPFLTMRIFGTVWKSDTGIVTEKFGDGDLIKLVHTDMEKHTALFAEKIGVQNTQSPQGS